MGLSMSRLNMWQRLGIVASILWVIGSGVWENHVYQQRHSAAVEQFIRACKQGYPELSATECYVRGLAEVREPNMIRHEFWFNAFVPIFLGWLSAYPLIWVTRWVLAGRQISN